MHSSCSGSCSSLRPRSSGGRSCASPDATGLARRLDRDGDVLLALQRLRDVLARHRTERLALLSRFETEDERHFGKALRELLGIGVRTVLLRPLGLARPRQHLHLTGGRLDGEAAWQEEVLRITVGDVLDITGAAESGYLALQDDAHRLALAAGLSGLRQRAVLLALSELHLPCEDRCGDGDDAHDGQRADDREQRLNDTEYAARVPVAHELSPSRSRDRIRSNVARSSVARPESIPWARSRSCLSSSSFRAMRPMCSSTTSFGALRMKKSSPKMSTPRSSSCPMTGMKSGMMSSGNTR